MGLLGLAGSLLGMIPKVGSPKGAKKGKSGGSKGKSTKKSAKKSTKKKGSTKKKQRKPSKKKKKKRKKKWGKFFTKARKLKNSLSKSKLVKRVKKAVKKAVLATKKTAKKAAKAAKKATKAAVQTVKKAATVAVKASKKITGGTVAKVASAYSSFKEGGWKEAVSVAVDFIPVVGNAKALYESVSGKDPITGRKLGKTERLISAGAVLGGPIAKGLKHGGKAVAKIVSGGSKSNKAVETANSIQKKINSLDQQINKLKKEGNKDEVKKLQREKNKLVNKLDTPDNISKNYDLIEAKTYERKIDNTKYFDHDKGDFGEEVTKIVAKKNNLGEDVSELFQVGRNGIDGTFLSKGPPPKLTMVESKASAEANFSYSKEQKKGGEKYFNGMLNSNDKRYSDFNDEFEKLKKENPGLEFDYIRVETDIKITKIGFGVEEVKVKDWKKPID